MNVNLALVTDPDEAHERRIADAYLAFQHARDSGYPNAAARKWCEVVRLIGERSREQIARMEQERGLS